MPSVAKIAFWLAGGVAAFSVLLVIHVLIRRLVAFLLHRRVSKQAARVDLVLKEHEKESFASLDRLLFQLGQVDHRQAIEAGLSAALERTNDAARPRLRKIYESLGLTKRYLEHLEESPHWQERMGAARLLGQLGALEAVPLLVKALRDPHEDASTVKLAAAQALGMMQAEEAIPLLLEELQDRDDWASPRLAELLVSFGATAQDALHRALVDEEHVNARIWAAQILGRSGGASSVPLLISRLSDRADRVRISAAEALGRIGDNRAVGDLVQAVMSDPVSPVRAEAARALGMIGDVSVVDHLVMLLANHDYWTRLRAIEAIERIKPDDVTMLEQALEDSQPTVRSRAAVALERVGALAMRIEELGSKDRAQVAQASKTLVRIGKAGLMETLQAALEHQDMRVRSRMCTILGEAGDLRAMDGLSATLTDPMWPVRVRAVEALAQLRPEDGTSLLLPLLKDEEETVRVAVVAGIKSLGVPDREEDIATVVQLFSEGNAEVRCSVIDAVGLRQHEKVDALLEEALSDPNGEVRLRATVSLATRGAQRFSDPLIQRLGDTDTRVRSAAVEGLGKIGTAPALQAVVGSLSTSDRSFRESLSSVIAQLGPAAVMKSATSGSVESRLACVWALGKTGNLEAVKPLERLAKDKDFSVRAAVAGAVAKLPDARSEAVLLVLLRDPNERVRAAAVNGLGRLRVKASTDVLISAMHDPDPFVRQRVSVALGQVGGADAMAALDRALNASDDPASRAFAFIGYGLLGNAVGFRVALMGLSDPRSRGAITEQLDREKAEIRQQFRENLHLEATGLDEESKNLDNAQLKEHYAKELKENQDPDRRLAAIQALQALGLEDQLDVLLSVVRTDPAPEVRRLAIVGLLLHPDDPRIPPLLAQALADPVGDVQVAAAKGLAGFADPAHNEALLRCFTLRNPELDEAVTDALARANTKAVRGFIDKLLGESRELVLRGGAAVLGMIGDTQSTGLLKAWLNAKAPAMRSAALTALGKLGTPVARDAMLSCIADTSEDVRVTAARALGKLPGASTALAPLTTDPSRRVRLALAQLVGESGQVGMVRLAESLAVDPDDTVRVHVLEGLLSLGDGAALESFVEHFDRQSIEVQQQLRQLADDGPPLRAVGELVGNSRQPETRVLGVRALKQLAKQPVKLLLEALKDPAPEVRIAAVQAVGFSSQPELQKGVEQLLRDPVAEVQAAARKARMMVIDGGEA